MIVINNGVSLRTLNTFSIDVAAQYFVKVDNLQCLREAACLPYKKYVLGGGSNLLFTKDIDGLVLQNNLKGIVAINQDVDFVWYEVQSGEIWHDWVMYTVMNGLGGIENLALVPGTVGAAPIQNIGAYGVEVKDAIESVNYFDWAVQEIKTLSANDCCFGYRDSIFKNGLKDKVFITSVVFKLAKHPKLNTSYGAIETELDKMGVNTPSVKDIAQAVINIRTSKLPDPKILGNAGSFFKNPTIPISLFASLQINYPTMPNYPVDKLTVKIPAGWLIEQCGWKGYRLGNVGVHKDQALVLVNFGGAAGAEVWALSSEVVKSVENKFGIRLEREVQVW